MCVAAVIHKPVSLEYLQSMQTTNPDGAGVAWLGKDQTIRFVRGLTPPQILEMQDTGQMSYPYLLHFRWATVGAEDHTNIHPFPLGEQVWLGESEGTTDSVLMHNGTWGEYNTYIQRAYLDGWDLPDTAKLNAMSDTAIAAWLVPAYPEILDEVSWATALATVTASGELDIAYRGTWTEHEGNQYSNLGWLPWSLRKSDMNSKFWAAYARHKGWDSSEDISGPKTTHLVPRPRGARSLITKRQAVSEGMDWDEYLEAKYGREVCDGVTQRNLESLEAAESEQLECALADELGYAEYPELDELDEFDGDLESEDPEAVNSWLAKRMMG